MKKLLAIGLGALSLIAPSLPFKPHNPAPAKPMVYAQEVIEEEDEVNAPIEYFPQQVRVCVLGEASKMLTPDRGVVRARVSGYGRDCTLAKDETMNEFDSVVSALEEKGVDKSKIIIDNFYARPCRDCHEGGCHGNLFFSFVIDDLSNTQEIISSALENGVKEISSICYEVSNMEEEYTNLLSSALENAKTKATQFLGEEGQLLDVREECVYYSNGIYRDYLENGENYVGGIEVKARVKAMFI